jgi:hypothetical protein
MRPTCAPFILFLTAAAGCRPAADTARPTVTTEHLDFSIHDVRFYGVDQKTESEGRVTMASGVLLMPWDGRPECSIRCAGTETLVEIRGRQARFPGRPLLTVASESAATVLAGDIELSRYDDPQTLTETVRSLLEAAVAKVLSDIFGGLVPDFTPRSGPADAETIRFISVNTGLDWPADAEWFVIKDDWMDGLFWASVKCPAEKAKSLIAAGEFQPVAGDDSHPEEFRLVESASGHWHKRSTISKGRYARFVYLNAATGDGYVWVDYPDHSGD